jgi:hypothetical protein
MIVLPWGLVAAIAVVATAAAWIAAIRSGRLSGRVALRGFGVGVVVAVVAFFVTIVIVPSLMRGTYMPANVPGLGFVLLVVLAIPALLVLWWGLALMPLGALLRRGEGWATGGAWITAVVAAPITIAAMIGASMVVDDLNRNRYHWGYVDFDLVNGRQERVQMRGDANCEFDFNGTTKVSMEHMDGAWEDAPLDARVNLGFDGSATRVSARISLGRIVGYPVRLHFEPLWSILATEAGGAARVQPGWTREHGTIAINSLEPAPLDYAGTVEWDCSRDS